jgi:hypothetical protein
MAEDLPCADDVLRALVDEYRSRCLWFLAPRYYPETLRERLRVLDSIQRHGDLEAFKRAGEVTRWLSAHSSAASAGS